MTKPVANKSIRLNYLDGVRGVAAFLVIFGHFKNAFFVAAENSPITTGFWNLFNHFFLTAEFCVQLFFVLSGFVLAYNSFTKHSFLTKQWSKRFFRLFAPVFLSSLVYFFVAKGGGFYFKQLSLLHTNGWITEHWVDIYTLPEFIKQFFFDFIFLSSWPFVFNINSALWTIPIEFYWSYVLFICFYCMKFLKSRLIENVLLSAAILFAIRFAPFKGVLYGMLFLSGALLARNHTFIVAFFSRWKKYLLLFVIIALSIAIEMKWLPSVENLPFRWTFVIAFLLILFVLVVKPVQSLFETIIVHWLGRISFSLYLLHLLVIGSPGAWLFVNISFFRSDAGLFALFFIVLLLALVLAHIFTKYVDEPMMNWFDRVYKIVTTRNQKEHIS